MTYRTGDILLGKYRVEALIGRGAFAQVYRATHPNLPRPRALKILRKNSPGVGSSLFQNYQDRFRLEARLGDRLDHPNLIQVYDFDRQGDDLVLVMEYAPGGSLAERIQQARDQGQAVELEQTLHIAAEVAAGLGELHRLDAVHRDLKPSNILFDEIGRAKVADFGLAQIPGGPSLRSQLSQPTPHPGTPGYMSPEQERSGHLLRPNSDVYAVGLILFELITGRNYNFVEPGTRASQLRDGLPTWLDDLIAEMLAKKPEERPWDGRKAADLIGQGLEKLAVEREEKAQLEAARREKDREKERKAKERQRLKAERQEKRVAAWRGFKERISGVSARLWLLGAVMVVILGLSTFLPRFLGGVERLEGTATPTAIETRTPSLAPTKTRTTTQTATSMPTNTPSITTSPTLKYTLTKTNTPTLTPLPDGYDYIPDLFGMNYKDAESIISNMGFEVSWVYGLHPDEPAGTIIAQSPEPGTAYEEGSEIVLTRTIYSEKIGEDNYIASSFTISSETAFGTKLNKYFTIELEEGQNYLILADMGILFSDCGMFVSDLSIEPLKKSSGTQGSWFQRCDTLQLEFTPSKTGFYGIGIILEVGGTPLSGEWYEPIELLIRTKSE